MPITVPTDTQLRTAINLATRLGYTKSYKTDDLFEHYVFSICVAAAKQHGARVSYVDANDNPSTKLVFRASPGIINSPNRTYTHALFDFPNASNLEMHVGIKVVGLSKELHECDLAILPQEVAARCRELGKNPEAKDLTIGIECKLRTGKLELPAARSFLGLTKEIHNTRRFLVTNSDSETCMKVVSHYEPSFNSNIFPRSSDVKILESCLVAAMKSHIDKTRT